MNVSDMQVPDVDDRVAAEPPPHDQSEEQDRERGNLDAQFHVSPANSKIMKERTRINPVTSKIIVQPLESD